MKEVKILLEQMSYNTQYRFLEMGKDDDELKKVGEKYGLNLPSPDIAVFKGLFAMADEVNRNGCNLPKEEVEKAMDSINGKAVDIDHVRRQTVGYWLGGELTEKNEIVTYGAFWKANYEEEYKDFKNRMDEGTGVAISMEAWGERVDREDGNYDLINIHFAGGALLDTQEPACANAGVLEFAKVIEKGNKNMDNKILEKARLYLYDLDFIVNKLYDIKNPDTKDFAFWDIQKIDFIEEKIYVKDGYISEEDQKLYEINFTLKPKLSVGKIAKSNKKENEKNKNGGNEQMEEKLAELQKTLASLEVKMEEQAKVIEVKEGEIASLKEEIETAKAEIITKSEALEAANNKLAEIEETEKKAKEEADAKLVVERKEELGEFAKDLSDEQLLDDKEYKIAKLTKENAELAAKKDLEKSSLEAGSFKNDIDLSEVEKVSQKIHKDLWK